MKSKFTKAVVALLAVFALSAVGVAQASAHEFNASVAGTLESKQSSAQVFRYYYGLFECRTGTTGTAKVIKGSQKTIKETVQYGGCAFGGGYLLKVSPAEWEFNAEGTITLLKPFTFTLAKHPTNSECTITFEPAKNGSEEHFALYKNLAGGKLATEYGTENVNSTGSGGECGEGTTRATVFGHLESSLPSGTLTWK
jgi:hypothetical protein